MEHNGTDYKHLPKGTAIIRLARLTYSRMVRRKYQIKLENQQLLDQIDGPFLLLSNHSHGIDFIMLSSSFPFHLKWVTGAYLFKMNAFVHYVVNSIAQCIAKEQGKSDLSTIIEMKKALAGGSVVGLFPEGTRTWDGDSIPVIRFCACKACVLPQGSGYDSKLRRHICLQAALGDEGIKGAGIH